MVNINCAPCIHLLGIKLPGMPINAAASVSSVNVNIMPRQCFWSIPSYYSNCHIIMTFVL